MRKHLGLAVLLALAATATAWASSGGFEITATGVKLGEMKESNKEGQPPLATAKAEVGKPFVLVAQGMAYPRGGKGSAMKPEAGSWSFDKKHFDEVKNKEKDETKVAVALTPTRPGKTRVRFTGEVLGYKKAYDVEVEVVAAKK